MIIYSGKQRLKLISEVIELLSYTDFLKKKKKKDHQRIDWKRNVNIFTKRNVERKYFTPFDVPNSFPFLLKHFVISL